MSFTFPPGTYFFGDPYWSQCSKKPLKIFYISEHAFPCCYKATVFDYDKTSIDIIQFHMKENTFCIIPSPNIIDAFEITRGFVKTFTECVTIVEHLDIIYISSGLFHISIQKTKTEDYIFEDFPDMSYMEKDINEKFQKMIRIV